MVQRGKLPNVSLQCFLNENISKHKKKYQSLKNFATFYQQNALLTIYKSFVRRHLDYSYIVYDQSNKQFFN